MAAEDMHCPACDTTIRATNLEYWYPERDDGMCGEVIPSDAEFWMDVDPVDDTREQLWFCPNGDCEVVRLFPQDTPKRAVRD